MTRVLIHIIRIVPTRCLLTNAILRGDDVQNGQACKVKVKFAAFPYLLILRTDDFDLKHITAVMVVRDRHIVEIKSRATSQALDTRTLGQRHFGQTGGDMLWAPSSPTRLCAC